MLNMRVKINNKSPIIKFPHIQSFTCPHAIITNLSKVTKECNFNNSTYLAFNPHKSSMDHHACQTQKQSGQIKHQGFLTITQHAKTNHEGPHKEVYRALSTRKCVALSASLKSLQQELHYHMLAYLLFLQQSKKHMQT